MLGHEREQLADRPSLRPAACIASAWNARTDGKSGHPSSARSSAASDSPERPRMRSVLPYCMRHFRSVSPESPAARAAS